MGYLLKEVLKTLCGVNQWSYAVFWKIGCQNTKILIWEESYYEVSTFSGIHGTSGDWSEVQNFLLLNQARESLHLLVNKTMMENQFNLVGEGLIGRAAVTGNHQWILSKGLNTDAHPPEVLKELAQQFSAGIQTISVIPVLPHGVVQFGSYLHITENLGFVEDVRALISQLGCVPGVLLSDENATKEPALNAAEPVYLGSSVSRESCGRAKGINSTSILASCHYNGNSIQTEGYIGQTSSFQASNMTQGFGEYHGVHIPKKISPELKQFISANCQLANNMIKDEVIPPNPYVWTKQQASLPVSKPPFCHESSIGSLMPDSGSIRLIEQQISGENSLVESNLTLPNGFRESHPKADHVLTSNFHENTDLPSSGVTELCKEVEKYQKSVYADFITPSHKINSASVSTGNGLQTSPELRASSSLDVVNHNLSVDGLGAEYLLDGRKSLVENDLFQALSIMLTQNEQQPSSSECINDVYGEKHERGVRNPVVDNTRYEDVYVQQQSGDDLFDVLGADFKNRLLNGSSWNNEQSSGPELNTKHWVKNSSASTISNSDSGLFSMTGFDRILDTMVSNRCSKQSQDDNVSCRTTLTNLSSSSAPNGSSSYGRVGVSSQIQGDLFGPPKTLPNSGAVSSSSFKSECSKESTAMYSRSSSIYGSSQISSWVESGYDTKPSSSVSTGYSKKPDETSKTGRKRLKPGENPRPRPKDRQMIQDRVKELREIVPNGAKCSIDALLERTIKHMLFLQSVTKHADKLKQTGESKIISKEGGLLLKDNIEGGATWAYEVGSQSMVCPIIVEDLNHPRQMLVEMLCEERGLFLEIADIIRGLGLTILKGVMETRNDKIWARFAVEANRDVTRMEIFISLVRLLEQTAKGGAEAVNAADNNTSMAHSFHQATSIPATGRPSSLL